PGPEAPRGCASSARCTWVASASSTEYTATVRRPSEAAARSTRTAISPRLATSRRDGSGTGSPFSTGTVPSVCTCIDTDVNDCVSELLDRKQKKQWATSTKHDRP